MQNGLANDMAKIYVLAAEICLRMNVCATEFASDCECDGLVHSAAA